MKTAYFTMGGPGSGKSYILENEYAHLRVIDCDSFKSQIAGYDPKNPAAVHAESSKLAHAEFLRTLECETADFVYDGTGANAEKLVTQIKAAKANGWQTSVIYVRCELETALQRNATRDRVVPQDVVIEKHSTIAVSFEIVSLYACHTRVVDNN